MNKTKICESKYIIFILILTQRTAQLVAHWLRSYSRGFVFDQGCNMTRPLNLFYVYNNVLVNYSCTWTQFILKYIFWNSSLWPPLTASERRRWSLSSLSTGQILCLFLQILQKVVLLKLTSKEEHFQKKIMTNDRLAKYEGKNLRRTISSGAGLQG